MSPVGNKTPHQSMKHYILGLLLLGTLAAGAATAAPTDRVAGIPRQARVLPAPAEAAASAPRRLTTPVMSRSVGRKYGNLHLASRSELKSAPVLRALGDGTTIYGSMIYSDAWIGSGAQYGLYTFSASANPSPEPYEIFGSYEANGGGAYYKGKYFYNSYVYTDEMGYTFSTFITYDMATREVTKITNGMLTTGFDQTQITHDMTVDPTDGTIYAISYIKKSLDDEGLIERYYPAISIVDPAQGWCTPVAETPSFIVIAANAAGELYAITKGPQSALYRVNKSNGDCTLIGATGLNPEFVQSATFDPTTDKLYWAAVQYDGTSGLYEVNTSTGLASKIASFTENNEFTGIFIPEQAVADNAPAAASDLGVEFVRDALSGALCFTAPRLSASGKALTGTLSAEITLDGQDFESREVQPGENVRLDVENLTEGIHNFGVTLHNEAGAGSRVAFSFHVGMDAPAAVSDLKLEAAADGCPMISWTAPAKGRNDGYIDPALIRYRVERLPSGLVVASDLAATSFTDRSSFDSQNVSYVVTPYIGSREGVSSSTAEALFGSGSELPVTFDFATKDDFRKVTIIDANNDRDDQYHWGAWYWGPDFSSADVQDGCIVYGYHWGNDADDWAIIPPFTAEAGRSYRVSFDVRSSSDTERFAVTAGTDKTVAAQTVTVMPARDFKDKTFQRLSAEFDAPAAGNCFVGFHVVSKKKAGYLYIDNVTIEEVALAGAPAAPDNFTATAGAAGSLKAVLSLTAPALTAQNQPLNEITRLDIYRGNSRDAIHSFENPAPGEALCWTDEAAAHGYNTYRAVAFNSKGQGEAASATVFVGTDIPVAVTDLTLTEENGKPVIRWTAPAEGQNGGYINSSALTYLIRRNDGTLLTNKATGTSFTDNSLDPAAKQYFIYYQVQPVSSAGVGDPALTDAMVYGDPYTEPFYEGFADRATQNDPWVMYLVKGREQRWTLMSQGQSPVCPPVDGDGGLAVFQSTYGSPGDAGRLVSPKLDLNAYDVPVLTFYVYNSPSEDAIYGGEPYLDRLIPELRLPDGSYVEIDEPIYVDDPYYNAGWFGYELDLSPWKSYPYVQLSFHAIGDYENDISLDGISVSNRHRYDLAMYAMSVPGTVKAGKDIRLKVSVLNQGIMDAQDFRINILRDGQPFTYITSTQAIPAGAIASFKISLPTTIEEEGQSHTFSAVIDWDLDDVNSNDASSSVRVNIVGPDIPEPRSLQAVHDGSAVELSWTGVNDVKRVADDMESHAAWETENIGDYTLIDGDGGDTYTFNDISYPSAGAAKAWQVFDATALGITPYLPEWKAYSGTQVLMSACPVDIYGSPIDSDDWLISPEILGGSVVSFMAKTPAWEWGNESFGVLWSAGSPTDRASFKALTSEPVEVPTDWTKYEYTLPEEAKYFAIRHQANDKFMLYLDDLNFIAKASTEGFTPVGYRLYRNGAAIADLDASALSHRDTEKLEKGTVKYGLSVLYANGRESLPAEASVYVSTSGISEAADGAVNISTEGHILIVNAPEGTSVSVAAANGMIVASECTGSSELRISLPVSGVYVVSAAGKTAKVIIK